MKENIKRTKKCSKKDKMKSLHRLNLSLLRKSRNIQHKGCLISFVIFSTILNILSAYLLVCKPSKKFDPTMFYNLMCYSFVYLIYFYAIVQLLQRFPSLVITQFYLIVTITFVSYCFFSTGWFINMIVLLCVFITLLTFMNFMMTEYKFNILLTKNAAKLFIAKSIYLVPFTLILVIIYTVQLMFLFHAYNCIDLNVAFLLLILILLIVYLGFLFLVISYIIETFTASLFIQGLLNDNLEINVLAESLKDVFYAFGAIVKLSFIYPVIKYANFLVGISEPDRISTGYRFTISNELHSGWQRPIGQYMLDKIDPYPIYYNPLSCIHMSMYQKNLLSSMRGSLKIMKRFKRKFIHSILINNTVNMVPILFCLLVFTIANMATDETLPLICLEMLIPSGVGKTEIVFKSSLVCFYVFVLGYLINITIKTVVWVLLYIYKKEPSILRIKLRPVYEVFEDQRSVHV